MKRATEAGMSEEEKRRGLSKEKRVEQLLQCWALTRELRALRYAALFYRGEQAGMRDEELEGISKQDITDRLARLFWCHRPDDSVNNTAEMFIEDGSVDLDSEHSFAGQRMPVRLIAQGHREFTYYIESNHRGNASVMSDQSSAAAEGCPGPGWKPVGTVQDAVNGTWRALLLLHPLETRLVLNSRVIAQVAEISLILPFAMRITACTLRSHA